MEGSLMKPNSIIIRKLFDEEARQRASLGHPCALCFFKDKVKTAQCAGARGIPPCIIGGVEYYFQELEIEDQSPEGYSLHSWNANKWNKWKF